MTPAPPRRSLRPSRPKMGMPALVASPWVIVSVVLVGVPLFATDLQLRRFTELLVLVLAVMGLNLLTGYTGVFSLGHGVFVGIGGFAMAELSDDLGLPLIVAIAGSAAIAGLFGVVLGLPALRIRGVYLALVTFGFALAFGPVARRLGSLTGAPTGRSIESGFTPPSWTGIPAAETQIYRYLVCLLVVAGFFVLMRNLVESRIGRALQALRDDELAAQVFGVNPVAAKSAVFGLSAAMAGAAGALQAFLTPFVSPDDFDVFLSFRLYAAAVLGGLGTIVGSVYGVAALIVIPAINGVIGILGSQNVVFGLGLVMLTYLAPDGVAGFLDRRRAKRG